MPFDTYEEAIELANSSDYGLAATIWTQDLKAAMRAIHELEAGFVQVNQNVVVQPMLPYGGVKTSGIGKSLTRCDARALRIEKRSSSIYSKRVVTAQ